jgi:hypothetical protein
MTNEERRRQLDDLAARLWTIHSELESLLPEFRLAADRKATRHILTDLAWATENCTVIGKHQVGQAMDDNMGTGIGTSETVP